MPAADKTKPARRRLIRERAEISVLNNNDDDTPAPKYETKWRPAGAGVCCATTTRERKLPLATNQTHKFALAKRKKSSRPAGLGEPEPVAPGRPRTVAIFCLLVVVAASLDRPLARRLSSKLAPDRPIGGRCAHKHTNKRIDWPAQWLNGRPRRRHAAARRAHARRPSRQATGVRAKANWPPPARSPLEPWAGRVCDFNGQ